MTEFIRLVIDSFKEELQSWVIHYSRVEELRSFMPRVWQVIKINGADMNIQDENGNTLLHLAILYKEWDFVKELLWHGANPLLQNNDGHTAKSRFCRIYNRFEDGRNLNKAEAYILIANYDNKVYEGKTPQEFVESFLII